MFGASASIMRSEGVADDCTPTESRTALVASTIQVADFHTGAETDTTGHPVTLARVSGCPH